MTGSSFKKKFAFSLLIITAVILLQAGAVFAAEPEFRLDIDSLNLQKGVSTNLVLSVLNGQGADVKNIKGLENFDVLSSSQSTSTKIINGSASYEKDYYYTIMPKSTGKFTLQGSVEYKGSSYETNELKINVSESSSVKEDEASDLFVKTNISSDEIYFGQKVALTYELYSRYNIEDFGFLDSVNIDGFIITDVPEDKLDAGYVYLNGNKYIKYEAKQMYLSPINTGAVTIPAYNFQVNVSTGDFFNSSKPVYLQTDSKELTVKPLPAAGKPADFSGIVGKLNIEADYSKNELDYGDSLTLNVTASGNCNLEGFNKVIGGDIPGFSVYETEKDMEEGIQDNQYNAKKEFEVILVPEKNGDIKINPIYISYFDPDSGTYEKAEIPGATIMVNGEAPQSQIAGQNVAPTIETVRIDQVSYGLQDDGYFTIRIKKESFKTGIIVLFILVLLAVGILLLFFHRRKQDKNLENMYKRLKGADDPYDVYNLFNDIIKYCFGISLKAGTRSAVLGGLARYNLSDPVMEIMDYMESNSPKKDSMYLKERIKVIHKKLVKLK